MRMLLIGLGVIVALLLGRMAWVLVPASGALTPKEPVAPGECAPVQIAPGTEDVTIDPVTGLVFVSAAERRTGETAHTNGIYVFDPADPGSVRRVSADSPADFRPHGISLWRGQDENGADIARLFVISHPAGAHQVLIYDVAADGMLTHLETVTDPAIRSPNDVAGAGPRQFYVTNDVYFGDNLMGYLEAFLGLPLGSIAYYDGEQGRIAARGLSYANGITLTDGGVLYASSLIGRTVHAYARNRDDGSLRAQRRWRVPLGLDNIEQGPDGALYIGGHPDIFAFLDHAEDPETPAPSQVVRFDPDTGEHETVFYSAGEDISASSVGAVHDGRLIVGAVFDSHVLVCSYQNQTRQT